MRKSNLLPLWSTLVIVVEGQQQREEFNCNICRDGLEVTNWDGQVVLAGTTSLSCQQWNFLAASGSFDEVQCDALQQLTFVPCRCSSQQEMLTMTSAPSERPTTSPTMAITNTPTQEPETVAPTSKPTTQVPTSEPSTSSPSISPTRTATPTYTPKICNICGDDMEVTLWAGIIFGQFTCQRLHDMSQDERGGMTNALFCDQIQKAAQFPCGCTPIAPSSQPTITRMPTETPSAAPVSPPTYWSGYLEGLYSLPTESPAFSAGKSISQKLSSRSFRFLNLLAVTLILYYWY